MPTKILRWGLLSTARINWALIPPLQASKRNRLAAIASRNQVKAEKYAREWNIPRAHGSYEALLADPDIDVIYNPLPNSLHAEWTIRAVEAGKHVLCEKPMALNTAEADAITAVAQTHQKIVAEAFMYRHHPQTLKIKELVESGAIGDLRLVRGAFTFNLDRKDDVRLDPNLGGGSIWDVGCYPVSYTRYVIGLEPEEVFAWQVVGSSGVDEVFTGQMRFPNGVLAQFDCSFRSNYRAEMEFVGSLGTIRVPSPYKPGAREKILRHLGDKEQSMRVHGPELLYSGEVEDMADAVLRGKPQRITLADSRGNAVTLSALIRSAKTGKPVRLEN